MPSEVFDVAIVGAGPAGLFAAQHILENADHRSIIVLDKGPGVLARRCPADKNGCRDCKVCTVLCGLGGAGLHSDGKLILDLDSGGYVHEFASLSPASAAELVATVELTLRRFDGKSEEGPQLAVDRQVEEQQRYNKAGFKLKLYPVRHLGTFNLQRILARFIQHLRDSGGPHGATIIVETKREVTSVRQSTDGFVVKTSRGPVRARKVVLAGGKAGASATRDLLASMGITEVARPVWVGVRVDVSADSARELMALSFDPKVSSEDERGRVKTHCFCRNGSLLIMKYRGAYLVGGHSPYTIYNRSQWEAYATTTDARVNFNILASRYLDTSAVQDLLDSFIRAGGNSVVVQDMGSFLETTRQLPDVSAALENGVPAKTADIRSILDNFAGIGTSIAGFLRKLSVMHPGLIDPQNRVYAPAIEWDYGTVKVNSDMETPVPGLYAVGDGAGLSQGIVHAGASGILAGMAICRDFAHQEPTKPAELESSADEPP